MEIIFAFSACAAGALLSLYMLYKKQKHTTLACPRSHPCDTVLHSTFSRSFGVRNEILGTAYFIGMILLLSIPVGAAAVPWMLYATFLLLCGGLLFSMYLIALQAFVIKSWCLWCLGIAAANVVLGVSLLTTFPYTEVIGIFSAHRTLWIILHNLGFILGVGAATITDIFFFKFLKDSAISAEEKSTMDTLTNVIWGGLAVLVVSGLALYLPEAARLGTSAKFLIKVVVVGVIIGNGVLLNMYVGPYIRRLSFAGDRASRSFRKLAFALGGISLTSWYGAFILGSVRSISLQFSTALLGYGALLVLVVVGSQIAEKIVSGTFHSDGR